MGLDMYLYRKIDVFKGNNNLNSILGDSFNVVDSIFNASTTICTNKICEIKCEEVYWRKANHIHNWFIENVQNGKDDCKEYYVSEEQLKELLDVCIKVKNDHSLAPTLLPTKSGFFFGNEEYNDCYFESINRTINAISNLTFDGLSYYVYDSSW